MTELKNNTNLKLLKGGVKEMTVDDIVDLFIIHYSTDVPCGNSMSDYYCGITNDLKRREKEHNAKILFAVKMANANEA